MVSRRQIRKLLWWSIDSPNLVLTQLNRFYHTRAFRRGYNPNGIDVMAEDWDNLLVLDACRYDLFAENHTLPGELYRKESRAAHTSEFIRGNFDGRVLTDTVYVTASPMFQRGHPHKYDTTFHAVVNVWREDGWDDECNTVLPQTMVKYALDSARTYPEKRMIVHFMQPHYPFIGSNLELANEVPDPVEMTTDIWYEMMRGKATVSHDAILAAYRSNFDAVQPHVERLLSTLSGKSVVTSDHGNMLGERSWPIPIKQWGHPPGMYSKELVTVPWLECPYETRREIVAEPPEPSSDGADDDLIHDRLRQLGYVEEAL